MYGTMGIAEFKDCVCAPVLTVFLLNFHLLSVNYCLCEFYATDLFSHQPKLYH